MPIHQKLHRVMQKTGYVQKSSHNREQNYRFASEGAFIEHVRPHMLEAGVLCYPIAFDQQIGRTPSEKQVLITGGVTFRFQDAEDGSFVDIVAPYSGADSTDKAPYKAMTGARKYALRQALLIETGDDPEKDEPVEKSATRSVGQPAEPPAETAGFESIANVLMVNRNDVSIKMMTEEFKKLGLTIATAQKLVGVESFVKDRGDKTHGEVLQEVASRLAADKKLADTAKKLLDAHAAPSN